MPVNVVNVCQCFNIGQEKCKLLYALMFFFFSGWWMATAWYSVTGMRGDGRLGSRDYTNNALRHRENGWDTVDKRRRETGM